MYESNVFNVDLTGCFTSSEIITNVSLALELPNARGKRINLKFNEMVLNQSQLLSIKSLIASYGSELNSLETSSSEMKKVCNDLEIRCLYLGADDITDKTKTEENLNINETKKTENILEERKENKKEEFYQSVTQNILNMEEDLPFNMMDEKQLDDIDVEETIMKSALSGLEYAKAKEITEKEIETEENKSTNSALNIIFQNNEEDKNNEDKETDLSEMPAYTVAPSEHEGEEYNFYEAPTNEPIVATSEQTIYVTQTLRSGQVLEYNGNIVVIGDCHPGSEIKATGDITVWGVLGCVAHAGIKGDKSAKIRALKMNAVQLRIADVYSRRPDGSNLPYIIRSAEFTPEEARLTDDGIVLYKMN